MMERRSFIKQLASTALAMLLAPFARFLPKPAPPFGVKKVMTQVKYFDTVILDQTLDRTKRKPIRMIAGEAIYGPPCKFNSKDYGVCSKND